MIPEPTFPIYLDNHATTPIDPRVLDEMMPYLTARFGNAGSRNHKYGWEAAAAVDTARNRVASLLGASAREIIFTSGATESNNLAIQGITSLHHNKAKHIITVWTEHKSVLDVCKQVERQGSSVTYLGVRPDGLIDIDLLKKSITPNTILVTIMVANNEIGTIQPIAEIGQLCRERAITFHSDAVQALGKIPLDVNRMSLDLASVTAHKLYGPKGCGALYVRSTNPNIRLKEMMVGGGQERGMRPGTLNVPGIVGFGKACEIAKQEMVEEITKLTLLRIRLRDRILAEIDDALTNGSLENRLPGNLNMSFPRVSGNQLFESLDDIAVSSGSACSTATIEPSYVLRALGLSHDLAHSSIRFGIGRFNTETEIDYAADKIVRTVRNLWHTLQPSSAE